MTRPSRRRLLRGGLALAGFGLLAGCGEVALPWQRAPSFVDNLIRGAKPADIPVEVPTAFDLLVNLKMARAIGLTIPPSVMQQATEVLQ